MADSYYMGDGTIGTGRTRIFVEEPDISEDDFVVCKLGSDPSVEAGGPVVESVVVNPGYGFTLHLSNAVQKDTDFTYVIVTENLRA